MRTYFRKREGIVEVEQQLAELALCGVVLEPTVSRDDLIAGASRAELERQPYRTLLHLIGRRSGVDDASPASLHLCRYERGGVPSPSHRGRQLQRLATMSGLPLEASTVDPDGDAALSVSVVLGDWRATHRVATAAPTLALPTWFDGVLAAIAHPRRLYRCYADGRYYGLIAALAGDEPQGLARLTGLRLDPLSITGATVPVERR